MDRYRVMRDRTHLSPSPVAATVEAAAAEARLLAHQAGRTGEVAAAWAAATAEVAEEAATEEAAAAERAEEAAAGARLPTAQEGSWGGRPPEV